MRPYLLFRLYGPLASFGDTAVGEQRPSATSPGKGAVLGLLAAALGIRREEVDRQQLLSTSLRFAVLQYASGQLLRDYHTAQVPSEPALKKAPHFSRRDELLAAPRRELNTILSYRDYRMDAMHVVAIWNGEGGAVAAPGLADLKSALEHPQFALYIGRKSCPLALPLDPSIENAASLEHAFSIERKKFEMRRAAVERGGSKFNLPASQALWIMSDVDQNEELTSDNLHIYTRNDEPLNRSRWQFGPRRELRRAWIEPESEAAQ